jgi:hypothetical protein
MHVNVQYNNQSANLDRSFSTFGRIANGIGLALINFGVDYGFIDSVVFFCVKHPMPFRNRSLYLTSNLCNFGFDLFRRENYSGGSNAC